MPVLYHYCSTAAFREIVSNRSIRLSGLSLSNDTMEGKLVAAAVKRLAVRDKLDRPTTEHLLEAIEYLEGFAEGLGFCLSEDGDLLSQWRGYAEDAAGVAIGFSSTYLDWLARTVATKQTIALTLEKVVYDTEEHDKHVEPTYSRAKSFIEKGAFKWLAILPIKGLLDGRTDDEIEREKEAQKDAFRSLYLTLLGLLPKLFLLKGKAFKEEYERRLISLLVRSESDSCLYQAAPGRVIPYRELDLEDLEGDEPIREVVLGPKHLTPPHLIEDFLSRSGFKDVKVWPSTATYR